MYYANNTSQCIVVTWIRCGGTFDQYFIANLLRSLFRQNF